MLYCEGSGNLGNSYADAMEDLHDKYAMEGKAAALANVSHDKSEVFFTLVQCAKDKDHCRYSGIYQVIVLFTISQISHQ